jgi:carboxyl-terminal processing protease
MKNKKKYYFRLKEVIILILITSFIVSLGTGIIISKRYETNYKDLVITDKNITKFLNAYQVLTEKYYQDIDKEALIDSTISSMFSYLNDPYTTYLNETDTSALIDSLSGKYEGVGVGITKNDVGIVVTEVLPGSSAYEKGIKVGDVLIKVNDEDITYLPIPTVSDRIVSSKDNKVTITVLRDNKELNFNLTVGIVEIPAIETEVLEDNIGYIDIQTFSLTASKQVREQFNNLKNSGITFLILDVRDNTGGYLSIAEDMAKIFLDKGDIVYSVEDKNGITVIKDNNIESSDLKIIVLINNGSASASEVLAGALKDSYGATLVGNTSYGKGKIQKAETFTDGSMGKFTIAKWLRPNGECVEGIGIVPDYIVNNTASSDDQLAKAIELLKEE